MWVSKRSISENVTVPVASRSSTPSPASPSASSVTETAISVPTASIAGPSFVPVIVNVAVAVLKPPFPSETEYSMLSGGKVSPSAKASKRLLPVPPVRSTSKLPSAFTVTIAPDAKVKIAGEPDDTAIVAGPEPSSNTIANISNVSPSTSISAPSPLSSNRLPFKIPGVSAPPASSKTVISSSSATGESLIPIVLTPIVTKELSLPSSTVTVIESPRSPASFGALKNSILAAPSI